MRQTWTNYCRSPRVSKGVIFNFRVTLLLTRGLPHIEIKRKSIQQRPAIFAMRGVNEHSGGFVYDNDLIILKNDIERNILRPHGGASRVVDDDLDKIVRAKPVADVFPSTVDFTPFGFHQIPKVHFAQTAKMTQQKILEPHLVVLGGGLYFYTVFHD